MNIEERVSFLEKQNKKLKLSNNISIFSLFLLLIFGFQQQYQMPDIIKAKKFVLIDENSKERAILTIDTAGDKKSPKLRFYNESNNIITSIGANSNVGYLSVTSLVINEKDSKKYDTLNLNLKSNEISLDSNNSNRCHFGYNNGVSSIMLKNSNNTNRAFFEVSDKYAKNAIVNDKSAIVNFVFKNVAYEKISSNDTICKSSSYKFINDEFSCEEKLGDENNYYKNSLNFSGVQSEYYFENFGSVALGPAIHTGGPRIIIDSKAGSIDLGHSYFTQRMGLNINGHSADSNSTSMFLGNILEEEYDKKKKEYTTESMGLAFKDNDELSILISRDIKDDESNIVTYTSNNKSIGIINNARKSKFYISKDYSDIYSAYVNYAYSNVESSGYNIVVNGLSSVNQVFDKGSQFYIYDYVNKKTIYETIYKITSGTSQLSTKYYDDNGNARVILGNAFMTSNGRDYISPLQSIFLLNNKGNVIDQLGNK